MFGNQRNYIHRDEKFLEILQLFFCNEPQAKFAIKSLADKFDSNQNYIHQCLLELENEKKIIRCKIEIGGKPVTHWQYNGNVIRSEYNNPFNLHPPFQYEAANSMQIEFDQSAKDSNKRRVLIKSQDPINIETRKNCFQEKSPDVDRIEFDSPRVVPSHRTFIKAKKNTTLNINSPEFKPQQSLSNFEKSGSSIDRSSESGSMGSGSNEIKVLKSQSQQVQVQSEKHQSQQSQQIDNQLYQRMLHLSEINKLRIEERKEKKDNSTVPNNFSSAFMTALTKNPVSVLYEFCQPRGMACEFKVMEMQGPPHKPRISTAVFINGKQFETATAANKKEGKRKAADAAIRNLISKGYFSDPFLQSSLKSDPKDGFVKRKEYVTSDKEKFGDRHSMYDVMASLIYNKLAELMDKLSPKESLSLAGRKVVAGIVMQDEKYDNFEVVSLSTGNRCITGDKMSLHGKIVNDSHAEIVARRSFMYFLYKQLDKHISKNSESLEIFEDIDVPKSFSNKRYFKIKDHIKFHLYISTAPCGDGALFCSKESIEKKYETHIVYSHEHEPIYENNSQGLLRSKIEGGEGTIPVQISEDCNQIQTLDGILHGERLRTMSCSDKIARWNYLGIQGALLEYFIKPIYLNSLMLGNLFHAGHLSRAVCCRLEKFTISPLRGRCDVNHPDLVSVYVGELHREIDKSNELSINWCHGEIPELVDGVTGELSMKVSTGSISSRISKAVLFNEFHKIYKKLRCPLPISSMTYREVKSMCREYDDKKKALYLKFFCAKYGSWICKPVEQSQFINCLNV